MFCAPRTLSAPSNTCYPLRSIHRLSAAFGNCVMTWQRSIASPKRSWCLLFTHDDVKNALLLAKAQSKEVSKNSWSSFSSEIWLDGNKLYMEQLFNRHPHDCCYRLLLVLANQYACRGKRRCIENTTCSVCIHSFFGHFSISWIRFTSIYLSSTRHSALKERNTPVLHLFF